MATLSTIRTRVRSLIANHSMLTSDDTDVIIRAEHESILEDTSWTRRKEEDLITSVATYTTGTISSSGTTVTGSGTTFTSGMVNRFIRAGSQTTYRRITAFTSVTSITIEEAFPSDVSAGTTYVIFQHVFTLASDFGRVLSMAGNLALDEITREDLDRIDPYRSEQNSDASAYSLRGLNSSGVFEIELWPVPSAARTYRLQYLKTNSLSSDTTEPLYRASVLVWKSAESAAFFLHARTGDASWLNLADRYHQRYLEDLQGAKEDDLGKHSLPMHIQDKDDFGVGTDWFLDHDSLRLL